MVAFWTVVPQVSWLCACVHGFGQTLELNQCCPCIQFYFLFLVATYDMTVYTSNRWLAGTDALVYVELFGAQGDSGETDIARGGYEDDFEKGR